MKTLKLIITLMLVAAVSVAQAQKVFKPTTVVDGKTILQMAKDYDFQVYLATSTIYKPGVTESAFVSELVNNFPKEITGLKESFVPYFKYIYSFHKRGLTESQVKGAVTGVEFADLTTNLSRWNAPNPGVLPNCDKFNWKQFLEIVAEVIRAVLPFLK
jgi:hypothetical protein